MIEFVILYAVIVALLFIFMSGCTWRLFNKLFGWHYVQYSDSATTFVARVIQLPNGKLQMRPSFPRQHYTRLLEGDDFKKGYRSWVALTWGDNE